MEKLQMTLEQAQASKWGSYTIPELHTIWKAWGHKYEQLQRKGGLNDFEKTIFESLCAAKLLLTEAGEQLITNVLPDD